MARTLLTIVGQASDEQAIEALATIERIASTARVEIQRIQLQVQRNLRRIAKETQERAA